MLEFERTIGASEVSSGYLNLSDDTGRAYGSYFPGEHRARIAVRDGAGRLTFAQKHHGNQLWGTLKNWFAENGVVAGTKVVVKFDPNERNDGLPVVHLIAADTPAIIPESKPEAESTTYASEIPIRLEKQLEDFLASNPELMETGLTLYKDEDGRPGQQYPTDVGVIDLLCCRPSGEFVVVELKRSRVSDVVVGQTSRYMGWVKQHIAGDAPVAGLILSHERDESLKYAVVAHQNLTLKYYKVRLELVGEDEL
jgi:hypothetical protein